MFFSPLFFFQLTGILDSNNKFNVTKVHSVFQESKSVVEGCNMKSMDGPNIKV